MQYIHLFVLTQDLVLLKHLGTVTSKGPRIQNNLSQCPSPEQSSFASIMDYLSKQSPMQYLARVNAGDLEGTLIANVFAVKLVGSI